MVEEWKTITDFGRVWSDKTNRELKQHRYGSKRTEEKQHVMVRLYFDGCKTKPKKYPVHQLVMKEFGSPCPEGMDMIDHIDGNVTNNHIDNLRWYNNTLNQKNMIATTCRNNTGTIGVSRIDSMNRYSVSIRHNGRRYYKYFFDAIYDDGKDGALEAAKEWRRQKEEEFGYITRV